MKSKHGEVWWTELNTRDPEEAREFYSKVVGWTPIRCGDGRRDPAGATGRTQLYGLLDG